MKAAYDRDEAIRLALSVKEEDIDLSDIPEVTELLASGKARIINRGRPRKAVTKKAVNIRFSPDVLAGLRAKGKGWQTKVDEIMRQWLNNTGAL